MLKRRALLLYLLCLPLLLGSSCQRKGIIPCPKPSSKRNKIEVLGPGGKGLEGVNVETDKNGRVKKRKRIL
ncbi:MAG: hypothetical protein LPK07_11565 [Hymenobacteraceae bacterium]|nr:hypothetical protein [Hymenobacteraceae bacterium]